MSKHQQSQLTFVEEHHFRDIGLWIMKICIIGMILATDISPAYLGYNMKKRALGYNVEAISIWVPFVALILGLAINFLLRVATHEIVFPDFSNLNNTSVLGGGAAAESTGSSRSIFYAVFFAILPVITSLVAFIASYTMSNPLVAEKKKLEQADIELTQHIDQLEAIISEYDSENDYLSRMLNEDEQKYNAALSMTISHKHEYYDYVRQRIAEHLGNPGAVSYTVNYTQNFNRKEDAAI